MNLSLVPIDSLKPDPHNAKRHPARQLEVIRESLRRFGQRKAIVVDAGGVILAGNGTWEAARSLGWTQIEVDQTELRGAEARAFALADNRSSDLGEWDFDVLAEQLVLPDIGDVGFSDAELTQLIGAGGGPVQWNTGAPTAAPEPPGATEGSPAESSEALPADAVGSETKPKPGKPIKLTTEQREAADEVFARFRAKHQEPASKYKLSEGQILTLICADWMAGN